MSFHDEQHQFEAELDTFYGTYPADVTDMMDAMTAKSLTHPEWSSYRRKTLIYEAAASSMDVHVFRYCPFYFELKSGRTRNRWGFDGIGGWMKGHGYGQEYQRESGAWKAEWRRFVNFNGGVDTDLDHHCVGYDNVLRFGLTGIRDQAADRLSRPCTDKQRVFLESVIIGCDCLMSLARKFSVRAAEMAVCEDAPMIRARLERIADSAARVPASPPLTFFEALNTLIFMREAVGSLEGIGVSTFGHMDRMLDPYYRADLEAGRLTRDEAQDLLKAFVAITDVKFETKRAYHETSTTVFIGGCDADGRVVFNDVTRMIIRAFKDLRLANPKFQARISLDHPDEYFELISDFIAAGTNVMAVYNDPVIIGANVRAGKAVEDARFYVGGGCQENILQNTEISSRATMFMSLGAILEMGFFPERWQEFAEQEGLELAAFESCETFDEFYAAFLSNLEAVVTRLIHNRNEFEQYGWKFNPCPLHSSTVNDCIEKAADFTEGGCRYSTGSVDLAGIGTIIDSLYTVRKVVYEQGDIPMRQLKEMLATDFEGEEAFRQYLVNRIPKFGRDDEEIREFTAKAFADFARVTSGQPNSRGGQYVASLFAHTTSFRHGYKTGATPDGRKAWQPLSKSMGPSVESLGAKHDIGSVFAALEAIDLTDYPVVAVLDIRLPKLRPADAGTTVEPVIRRFLETGGSVLQVNTIDANALREAREDPTKHPDLVVRVSGFSAYFRTLTPEVQEEVIRRTELHV